MVGDFIRMTDEAFARIPKASLPERGFYFTYFMNISYQKHGHNLIEGTCEIAYGEAQKIFAKLRERGEQCFLFESKDVSPIYGRLSMIGIDPVMRISGKEERFSIKLMQKRGTPYFEALASDFGGCDEAERTSFEFRGVIRRSGTLFEESERCKQQSIASVVRRALEIFKMKKRCLLGLYGAFSYDFVRLFEYIEEKLPKNIKSR